MGRVKRSLDSTTYGSRSNKAPRCGGLLRSMLVPHSDFVPEGPPPMEEPATTVDAEPADDLPSVRFSWAIKNFSRLNKKQLYSKTFDVGGYKWRVLMFPKGSNVDHLSLYLRADYPSTLPIGRSVYAKFSLTVVNPNQAKFSVQKDRQHEFNARESKCGFTKFIPLHQLNDPGRGYLRNDTLIIEADVAVCRHVKNCSHDSKKVIRFRSLEKPKEDEFSLELSKYHNYDDVVERVAQHLGLGDPSKIRLTTHSSYLNQPKRPPIKYRGVEHLSDMLVHYNQTSDILYYEVLDIPLPEMEGLKTLKVAFHHATKDEVVIHTIRLPEQSTVGDVISDLKTKVELSHSNAEVRLLSIYDHKINRIFLLCEKIMYINDQYWTLRGEEIPEEEKEIGPQDILMRVYHSRNDTTYYQQDQNFGEPFVMVIYEGETLAEVKVRLQNKLETPDEEFSKWKIAFMSFGRSEYLQDTDIVSARFVRREAYYGAGDQYLMLKHSDNPPKRSHSANQAHELASGNGTHVIEASADIEDHNTESALGHGTEAIKASAEAVADETDTMNSKVEPTGTVSFEREGIACICTSSGLKIVNVKDVHPLVKDPESWRGFPVGKDHASLLHDTEAEHPDFFIDVKYSSARRVIQSLNLFASNLANLASDKHGHLSRDDLRVMRDELSDLERDGFRIRWAIESVDSVFTLCFQLPLQQEITQLTAESTHLRGEIENLQQKTASLKEKIEHAEKELAVAENDIGKAEVRLKVIASELETRGRLLAEYNSILH